MRDETYVFEALMQPDTELATELNAYVQNHNNDEREKAAKALVGGPLYDEHDPTKQIGRVLDGYVQKEGPHKNGIVQVFEVTDPNYVREIMNGKLRNVSMGIDVQMFDSPLIKKGVHRIVFNELSLVADPGVENAKIITASKVRVSTGEILYQRLLASRKNNVSKHPDQKMSVPVTASAAVPPAAPVPSAPPAAPEKPAEVVAPAAPAPVPVAPAAPAAPVAAPEPTEEDKQADEVLAYVKEMATKAAALGMTVPQYRDYMDKMLAAGQEAANKQREEEERAKQFVKDQAVQAKRDYLKGILGNAAMHQEKFEDLNKRTIDRSKNVDELKEIETRFVEERMTAEDIAYLKEVVGLSEEVAALKASKKDSVPFHQFTRSLAEEQRDAVKSVIRNVKPVAQQKAVDIEVSAKMTDSLAASTVPVTASRKRELPSTVRLVASKGAERLNVQGYDVPENMDVVVTNASARNAQDFANHLEFIRDSGITKRARVGVYDCFQAPEATPQYTQQLYGNRFGVVASRAPTGQAVQYGFDQKMLDSIKTTAEGRAFTLTASKGAQKLSIVDQNNPALAWLATTMPDVHRALKNTQAPKNWLDAYSDRVKHKALTPEVQLHDKDFVQVLASQFKAEPVVWNQWQRLSSMSGPRYGGVVEPMDI